MLAGMATPVSTIRNLGPATEHACARAGIASAEELRALGADAAYSRLIAAGEKPHFIGYYALALGLMGRPWTDCQGAEKAALRVRFDTLVAEARRAPDSIERVLDEIGLPSPRRDRPAD